MTGRRKRIVVSFFNSMWNNMQIFLNVCYIIVTQPHYVACFNSVSCFHLYVWYNYMTYYIWLNVLNGVCCVEYTTQFVWSSSIFTVMVEQEAISLIFNLSVVTLLHRTAKCEDTIQHWMECITFSVWHNIVKQKTCYYY